MKMELPHGSFLAKDVGALAEPDDPDDLARAIARARRCDRDACARHAVAPTYSSESTTLR